MLAFEPRYRTADGLRAFCECPAPTRSESPGHRYGGEREGVRLAALTDTPLASRFCSWAGLSGRRYIFSVYPWSECPAFCRAVLLAAARDDAGRRHALLVFDTGAFPEPALLRAKRDLSAYGPRLEFHLHLLASSGAERESVLADLAVHSA